MYAYWIIKLKKNLTFLLFRLAKSEHVNNEQISISNIFMWNNNRPDENQMHIIFFKAFCMRAPNSNSSNIKKGGWKKTHTQSKMLHNIIYGNPQLIFG